jgi:hypothetical protein
MCGMESLLPCLGSIRQSQGATRFGRTSERNLHPLRQIKTPLTAAPKKLPSMRRVRQHEASRHVAVKANLTIRNRQVKLQSDVPEPMCPARLMAIQPSRSACASGPPTRLGVSASQNAVRFCRTSGWNLHPLRQMKTPLTAALSFGGEGGIRTHVPGLPDHLISSQRRYGHFGTSPDRCAILPAMQCIANIASRAFGY